MMQHKRFGLLVLGLLLYAGVLLAMPDILALSTQHVCQIAIGVGLFATLITGFTANNRFWSVQSLYMIITAVFNLGLVLMVSLGRNVVNPAEILLTSWIYTPEGSRAAIMAALAILAGAIGCILTVRDRKPPSAEEPILVREKVGFVACALVTLSILGWAVYCVSRGGIHIFLASKGEFNDKTLSAFIDFFYWGILFGLGLVFATKHRYLKFTLILFAIWGLDAFLLGLRGQVLFPIAAAVIVGSKAGTLKIRFAAVAIGLLVMLVGISIVRDLRTFGAGHISQSVGRASAADSLVELGGTLQSTVMAMQFVDKQGEMQYGGTYLEPIYRVFGYYLIPGLRRVDANDDMKLSNQLIKKRIGPIGFSTLAEGYLNFGFWGVQGVMFLIGLFLGRMDSWDTSIPSMAAMLAVLHPLLDHVRQAFTPFPTYLALGLLVAILISRMVLTARKQSEEIAARATPILEPG